MTALAAAVALALPAQDRTVVFDTSGPGVSRPIPTWGLDLAWLNRDHVRRGVIFMGPPQVDVIRASFTGDWPLVDGDLGPEAQAEFDLRMSIVDDHTEADTALYLNNDTDTPHASFNNGDGVNAAEWARLIDATRQKCVDEGRTVLSVAPFNEPDYTTWQGSVERFGDVSWQLRNTFGGSFVGIRLSGGNTLNNDVAAPWYDALNGWNYLEEGNTHQLAGSFDTYAAFYQSVEANGDVGANDELHNVMEAMVGAEYGMDVGIWWGTAEYARGEFVKASDGMRLGYAEHRPNWTAASVYRAPDGKVQAFVGESERQALPTTYRFVSKDRPVFYDGHGPQRTYTVTTTGGPGYATPAHRNAEKVVNITWGEDVPPAIDGRYHLVSRHSGKVMEVAGGSTGDGANIRQNRFGGGLHQQWDVTPLSPMADFGDYSYFTLTAAHSGKAADVEGHSYNDGGNLGHWPSTGAYNQLWFLEYVEDGWFHVRNRWSGKYLDVSGVSMDDGANIHQWEGTGGHNQQWRLIPVGAPVEFVPPATPTQLVATANAASVDLAWDAVGDADLAGYHVYRATSPGGDYELIARHVPTNAYSDPSANQPIPYYYKVRAADESLNLSAYSTEQGATPSGDPALVAHLGFEGSPDDASGQANHGEVEGGAIYGSGWVGAQALVLDGTNHVSLPAEVVNHDELTLAAWVRWNGGSDWQRIFDFGNGTAESLFLTPKAGGGGLRFEIFDPTGGTSLNAPVLGIGRWVHVAVSLGATARLYVDGTLVDESGPLAVRPSDFNPVLNLIGESQFPNDPRFSGLVDDFRIYNHELPAGEVMALAHQAATVAHWDFEDGTNGQAFTPAGQPDGSGGSLDTESGILMRGFNAFYGPSWTALAAPNGGGLALNAADNHQDAYVTGGPLHDWSPAAWTIECSVLLEELAGYKTLIGRDGSSQGDVLADFYLQKTDANRFRVSVDTVGGTRWVLDGSHTVEPNTWYALAARSDGSTLSLWLDEGEGYQQIGAMDISAQSMADNALQGSSSLNWTFGRGWYNGGFVDHIDGRLDNVRFSQAALAPQDLIPLHPVPEPPSGLAAEVGSSTAIGLSWSPSSWATSYKVKRSTTTGGPYLTVASMESGTGFEDSGLTPGETYFYVVSAENATGESTDSAEESATTWTPGEAWRFEHFGVTGNLGAAADGADPDGDRVVNCLERAFGGDPMLAEQDLMPSIDDVAAPLSITYRKALDATDLDFEVQESTDLVPPWIAATGTEVVVGEADGVQVIRFTRPVGGEDRLFLRLQVCGH